MQQVLLLASIILLSACKAQAPIEPRSQTLKHSMHWNGEDRTYYTYVPKNISRDKAVPLLFGLHGGGGTAKTFSDFILGGFDRLAEEHGFIVVYPQGIEKQWNDGRGLRTVRTMRENTDDVGFIVNIN